MVYLKGIRPVLSLGSLFEKPEMSRSHSLNVERRVVAQHGGQVNMRLNGPDGRSRFSGKPMEVKYATKGRWRIGQRDHEHMMSQNGIYYLVNESGQQRQVSAHDLDKFIKYKWLTDLRGNGVDYRHAFVYGNDIGFR